MGDGSLRLKKGFFKKANYFDKGLKHEGKKKRKFKNTTSQRK